MNPELQRNIWLNISSSRMIAMPLILGAILWASHVIWGAAAIIVSDGTTVLAAGAHNMARTLYFLIVVVWGTWLSSRAVVGEIRDRTWDGQRLSAIPPWAMVWGKLFGSTIFVWYGGLICLGVVLAYELSAFGPGAALQTGLRMVSMGVFAQAVALLVSLLAVRRNSRHLGSQIIGYQVIGILAGLAINGLWYGQILDEYTSLNWFDFTVSTRTFLLISIVLFMAWVLVGCYRLMRQELQFRAGPLVWIAFLFFMIAYFAGLASLPGTVFGPGELLTMRIMIATGVAVALTYIMLFFDAKDMVQFRQAASRVLHGRIFDAVMLFPSYIYAGIAAIVFALILTSRTAPIEFSNEVGVEIEYRIDFAAMIIAGIFFLIRDIALVVGFNAGRIAHRGDFAAAIFLVLLYFILPLAFLAVGARDYLLFFWPFAPGEAALVIAIPALQALMVSVWALSRLRARYQSDQ